jgi:hypothetical protein
LDPSEKPKRKTISPKHFHLFYLFPPALFQESKIGNRKREQRYFYSLIAPKDKPLTRYFCIRIAKMITGTIITVDETPSIE